MAIGIISNGLFGYSLDDLNLYNSPFLVLRAKYRWLNLFKKPNTSPFFKTSPIIKEGREFWFFFSIFFSFCLFSSEEEELDEILSLFSILSTDTNSKKLLSIFFFSKIGL